MFCEYFVKLTIYYLINTLMVLLCCIVMLELLNCLVHNFNIGLHPIINLYNNITRIIMNGNIDEEADDEEKKDENYCNETGSEEDDRRNIIFVDGPACIGKTTICDDFFDFEKYLKQYEVVASKSSCPDIQFLYDTHIFTDILLTLINCSERSNNVFDRSIYSQFVYGMLFRHNGHILDHETFKKNVRSELTNPTLAKLIRDAVKKWKILVNLLVPDCNVYVVWVVPTDEQAIAKQLKIRNDFETVQNFDLLNYTKNQIYLCKCFHEMSGDDKSKLIQVDKFITREYLIKESGIDM